MCKALLMKLENKAHLRTIKYYSDLNLLSLNILENRATLFSSRISKMQVKEKKFAAGLHSSVVLPDLSSSRHMLTRKKCF